MVKLQAEQVHVCVCVCLWTMGVLLERAALRCNNKTPEAPITPASHTTIMHTITHLQCVCPWKHIQLGKVYSAGLTLKVTHNVFSLQSRNKLCSTEEKLAISALNLEGKTYKTLPRRAVCAQKHEMHIVIIHIQINIHSYSAYTPTHTNTHQRADDAHSG